MGLGVCQWFEITIHLTCQYVCGIIFWSKNGVMEDINHMKKTNNKDFYSILGTPSNSSQEDIKKAYRTLAKKFHPDTANGNNEKFREVSEAYEVLSDKNKRADYDTHQQTTSFYDNPTSFFYQNDWPGFSSRGSGTRLDIQVNIHLTMDQAYYGISLNIRYNKIIECKTCLGSGSVQNKTKKCIWCNGSGKGMGTINGVLSNCSACRGEGFLVEKCSSCGGARKKKNGATANITVPPKTKLGNHILVPGHGNILSTGKTGDLRVCIIYDKQFEDVTYLSDGNLVKEVSLPWENVLMGEQCEFKLFSSGLNKISVKLDPSIPSGSSYRLKGFGFGESHLIIKVRHDLPTNIDEDDRLLIARVIKNAKSKADSRRNSSV